MGFLADLVMKGVETASKKAVINTAEKATVSIISAASKAESDRPDSEIKNGILFIKPTRSSEDYINLDAVSVVNELIGAGFEKVQLQSDKSLSSFGKKKYGKVKGVTINGKTTFLGVKKVPSTSYVVVEYFDFKESIDKSIYNSVKKITPGIKKSFMK